MELTKLLQAVDITKGTNEIVEPVIAYLKEVLETCGDDTTRKYEEAVVALVDGKKWTEKIIEPVMEQIMESENADLAYAGFYALCSFYRRRSDITEYGTILFSKRAAFSKYKSFAFLLLMYEKMATAADAELIRKANALCLTEEFQNNWGVLHCYCECVAEACEIEHANTELIIERYLDAALERIDIAIDSSDGYAKFYVTKARLLVIKAINTNDSETRRSSYFSDAMKCIDTAVNAEKVVAKMIDYQITGTRIQTNYYKQILSHTMEQQEASLKDRINDINVKNLEFLGFFSGIMGLLIADVQMLTGMGFQQAAPLILLLTGCIISAFGALGFILHGTKERLKTNSIIVGIGFALVVMALIYGGIYAL